MKLEGEPVWIEIPDDDILKLDGVFDIRNGKNYIHCIDTELGSIKSSISIAFVLIAAHRIYGPIKSHLD